MCKRGNLRIAETTVREIGRISLEEALWLTLLIALKDPGRRSRVATRWLVRFLEEHPVATIADVVPERRPWPRSAALVTTMRPRRFRP